MVPCPAVGADDDGGGGAEMKKGRQQSCPAQAATRPVAGADESVSESGTIPAQLFWLPG